MSVYNGRRQSLLALVILVLAMTFALSACGPLSTSTSSSSGVLVVRIGEFVMGGQPRPPPPPSSVTPPTLTPYLFTGGTVRVAVVRPEASKQVVAEQETGSANATFRLPAGRYWVFLPFENQPAVNPNYHSGHLLPDRTSVFAWSEVLVPAGGTVEVTLTIETLGA